jgi:predicted esterase
MSFSQGAAFLLLICIMQEKKLLDYSFKFAILVAPFKSRSSRHDHWLDGSVRVTIPSLVVMGVSDKVIEKEMTEEVLGLFDNRVDLVHPGGHFVPANSQQKKVYLEFLQEMKKEIS